MSDDLDQEGVTPKLAEVIEFPFGSKNQNLYFLSIDLSDCLKILRIFKRNLNEVGRRGKNPISQHKFCSNPSFPVPDFNDQISFQ